MLGGRSRGPGPVPMLWSDGRLHEGTRVPFDLSDRGLLLGDGLFDTAMALGGRIAFEEEHVERLASSAETLGFAIDRDRVVAGMRALAATIPRAAIRTTVTRGSGPRGLAPPAAPLPTHWASAVPLSAGFAFSPITLIPASIRRNETSPTSRLKTLGYLDAVIAAGEARASGFDEALFLNTRDRVACAGTGNLFLLEEGQLLTPPIADGVLPGIMRSLILSEVAPGLSIAVKQESVSLERVFEAASIFLTNSLRLAAPVNQVGQRNIPYESSGIFERVAAGLRQAIARSCDVTVGIVTGR